MTTLGNVSMSPETIPALAAIFGSLVGALGSSISTSIPRGIRIGAICLQERSSISSSRIPISSPRARASWWTHWIRRA
jgi:hypothetical protein